MVLPIRHQQIGKIRPLALEVIHFEVPVSRGAFGFKGIGGNFRALPQPNEVIRNRIILEAEPLLVHTPLTSKEITYEPGYNDPAYFSRLFMAKTSKSPSASRANFLS